MARLADLERLDLLATPARTLPWHLAARLDRALPTHLDPARRPRLDRLYSNRRRSPRPARRRFTAWSTTPVLADGRVKLRLALLSPAGRPIAVIADLAASGKAHGPMRAATCAAATQSTTGPKTAASEPVTPRNNLACTVNSC